jgi:hypothetical protein
MDKTKIEGQHEENRIRYMQMVPSKSLSEGTKIGGEVGVGKDDCGDCEEGSLRFQE